MKIIDDNLKEFKAVDHASRSNSLMRGVNPLVKLLLSFVFLILVISRGRYDVMGLILLAIIPICIFIIGNLSFGIAVKRLKVVLPFVLLMGVLEPIFNKAPILISEDIAVRAGFISGLVLILKSLLAVLAGYILISVTPIEEICYALRKLHIPKVLVIVILLVYRYMGILMSEGRRIATAYELRAPGQRGVNIKVWGSLLGQMLLRSMDRAESLYQSMLLRGFDGDFYVESIGKDN